MEIIGEVIKKLLMIILRNTRYAGDTTALDGIAESVWAETWLRKQYRKGSTLDLLDVVDSAPFSCDAAAAI